nr:LOW QUALITY PROTEIN: DNA polymerase eta [Coffea arabica]
MPVARPESSDSRVIAHVDMDCFYVQVEQRKQPHLRGQPTAVVQYNSWKGGALIAVSYEARKHGVKRSMRGDEAKHVCPQSACPQIQLVQVPVNRGKADLTVYRNAGSEVVSILARKGRCERASIDEVYLDLTEAAELMLAETPESLEAIHEEAVKSHVLGLDVDGVDSRENVKKWLIRSDADRRDKLLACGAVLVAELRLQVLQETRFTCSAGIAHNKMLAKLVSGMNKPAQQTVVPFSSVKKLLEGFPIKKMKQLGGKLGTSLQTDLGVETVGDLLQFPEVKLQECYGMNTGTWLWNIARGINGEEVEGRLLPKSHGAGKTFPGPAALRSIPAVEKWLNELCDELNERLQSDLEKNKRIAHTLTLHASAYKKTDTDSHKKFPSKSCPLRYGTSKIQEDALLLFQAGLREYLGSYQPKTSGGPHDGWGIIGLSVSASKIVAIPSGTRSISNYFHSRGQICSSAGESNDRFSKTAAPLSPSGSESNSGVHFAVSEIESPHKEEKSVHALASFDLKENETQVCKDKDPSFSSTMSQHDGFAFAQEIVTPSSSGTQSCFTVNQTESQKELSGENFLHVRLKEKKTSSSKEKGTPSILNFFQSRTLCASPKQQHSSPFAEAKASSSSDAESIVNSCFEAFKQKNLPTKNRTRTGTFNFDQDEQRRSWSYKIDEIDHATLNELPLEIQEEVNVWLRPQKRANILKKGSSIPHYFLPTKDK